MQESEVNYLIKNGFDLHVHCGPDVLPRKYTPGEIFNEERGKIKGMVLKTHSFPSTSLINAVQNKSDELALISSITLNAYVGGLNVDSIYGSATMSKKFPLFVWFPTMHAMNHMSNVKGEYEIPPVWVQDLNFKPRFKSEIKPIEILNKDNELLKECKNVLKIIKKMNCILATGHLSSIEAKVLAENSLEMQIPTILTHPMQKDIKMPIEDQVKLAKKGAYVEFCYIMYKDRGNKEDYAPNLMAEHIKKIGSEKCIISSDTGQMRNESPSECLSEYIELLSKEKIDFNDFEKMLITNPKKILNIKGGF